MKLIFKTQGGNLDEYDMDAGQEQKLGGIRLEAMKIDVSNMNLSGEAEFEIVTNIENEAQIKRYLVNKGNPDQEIVTTGKGLR